ncbi:hypothetical protein PR202_ga29019 [Eleusine coracana subsp. coracana]|uniref:Peroxidase n=1 Tax=Eleusine coracana subsp. coracana TaxID=191504 RepID=A0AAV5DL40_ELECO|nr:hypothetical protein QOZ80_7AG0579030 [Eleusine coracana subsp. coracana]GJN10881.1 hypothetical protein PR202_ga29019 [Eleusine coracana subsp. coracana]
MAKQQLAVLITLLAFLGPAACQQQGLHICFNGWLKVPPLLSYLLCPPGSRTTNPPPSPSPNPAPPSGAGLSYDYYNNNGSSSYCPSAESLVKDAVKKAIDMDPGVGAGLIRLFFHDCFVRGCDASVLLNTTTSKDSPTDTEREGPPNKNSLRGFEVIDAAKAAIEATCPGTVSCADIVAFAARDASSLLSYGKINMKMPGGRLDGRVSFANETDQLPGPFSSLAQLQSSFREKGLSSDEMVTLSGAHSIGKAHCGFFSDRLPPNPSTMDYAFATELEVKCQGNEANMVHQDYQTAYVLDNKFYQNVRANKVLFDSDDVLKTVREVKQNAEYPEIWERKFEKAMENLGRIVDVKSRREGEIRETCWRVNGAGY